MLAVLLLMLEMLPFPPAMLSLMEAALTLMAAVMQKPEQLRKETLEALARSENAHKHYLDVRNRPAFSSVSVF